MSGTDDDLSFDDDEAAKEMVARWERQDRERAASEAAKRADDADDAGVRAQKAEKAEKQVLVVDKGRVAQGGRGIARHHRGIEQVL